MHEVRQRLTTWWNGGDIGRPAMIITVPRETPREQVPVMPQPEGWVTDYSTTRFDYRVNLGARRCICTDYYGEAVPHVSPDLAPNCLALFLGCIGEEMPGTVWCRPCMSCPEEARFDYDPGNFYWNFSMRLGREFARIGKGKFLQQFPDLIEGLDTLAAMRGTEELLFDLVERPDWVHSCLRQITDRYFRYYDVFYDLMRDETGGSHFWCWAPGRMAKFQCDFSAMISPEMFGEFMVPILNEMTERVSYSMYHWDGPGAIPHHDHLLGIPQLDMIQWTAGAGAENPAAPRWWKMHHKTVDAGKKVFISAANKAELLALKKEFGPKLKQFLIECGWKMTLPEAEELLEIARC